MVVAGLASRLDPGRYRSIVCLFREGWLRQRCETLGLETHVIPARGMLDLTWLRQFRRLLRDRQVGLVHAHEFDANTYGTLGGRLAGIPTVATVHGRSYYADRGRRRLAYRLVSRAGTMVAVSEDVRRFVVERTGVAPDRIRVIYNGIAPGARVPDDTRAALRQKLGIGASERVVLVVGNLYPVKGHEYLLDALPEVLGACPSTVVLLAGRGDRERSLREQAARLGIDPRVRFLGLRDDVPALLAIADLFVQPSLSEGLSIAILEAMAAGKPVITTSVGGNPELVVDGETGLLVPPAASGPLAAAMIRLLQDTAETRRLGDAGRARVNDRFTIDAMVEDFLPERRL
jgi:glycosyltransferase involved in cell wall biosynthesis